jgi:predicted dehydrogenase
MFAGINDMKTPHFTRREFLKHAALSGAALVLPAIVPASVLSADAPSNRITIGLVGMGLMMHSHHHIMLGRGDVQVLAVCDVDRTKRDRAKAETEKAYAAKQASGTYRGCDAYNEYESVVGREDIDAVFVVTPDHWHTMISVAAMRHGKDVYVQKPMTLTIREGRLMSDTAKQSGAILQVGSQQRSERAFRKACEIVRNGWIGKVHTIYTQLGVFPPF